MALGELLRQHLPLEMIGGYLEADIEDHTDRHAKDPVRAELQARKNLAIWCGRVVEFDLFPKFLLIERDPRNPNNSLSIFRRAILEIREYGKKKVSGPLLAHDLRPVVVIDTQARIYAIEKVFVERGARQNIIHYECSGHL